MLMDFDRAARRPPNRYTEAAWGAGPGEPLAEFPRALRRMLLELDVKKELADRLVDPPHKNNDKKVEGKGNGKGKNREGKGNGKGKKGEGKGNGKR